MNMLSKLLTGAVVASGLAAAAPADAGVVVGIGIGAPAPHNWCYYHPYRCGAPAGPYYDGYFLAGRGYWYHGGWYGHRVWGHGGWHYRR